MVQLFGFAGPLDSGTPLTNASLFANVDLLARSHKPDNDAPLRDTFGKFDEVIWLGLVVERPSLLDGADLLRIEGSLRFIEYQDVLGRNGIGSSRVGLNVGFNATDECPPSTTCWTELVLEYFDERSVSR